MSISARSHKNRWQITIMTTVSLVVFSWLVGWRWAKIARILERPVASASR